MRILIEEHQYPADAVHKVLDGITTLRDINGMISVNYVGYFYNPTLKDCVFILPKVLLEDVKGEELVFGHAIPEKIINLEETTELTQDEYEFIYELSVWIYRAIVVYRDNASDNTIIKQQNVQQMGNGRLRQCNTFLDILLALQKFNLENQDFFFFILRNIHSGFNKINWTRTISHSTAIVQSGHPIYLNLVNKKRKINFDEELLVIFFSILSYIHDIYGFPVKINIEFPLITGDLFKSYLNGMGKERMMQIKYKYFSDKALYLWELCYTFFDQSKKINVETDDKEYLLAKNFNIVFEAIIDELVGDKSLPKDLKDQGDGKRVDHLFQYRDLTNNKDEKPIYYIGDSKYYKRNSELGKESVFKQFTYARNVIQWNIDLFNDGTSKEQEGHIKLRDEVTEGYNIIPNFFISAQQTTLKREDIIKLTNKDRHFFQSRQFDNRLFDRDTFLIAHYDVNFLFVVALYGRNNPNEKKEWKQKVREMFRSEIQKMLAEKYDFYAMQAHPNVDAKTYLKEHFQQTLGKIFTPFGNDEIFSLALDKSDPEGNNEELLAELRKHFFVVENGIGLNPEPMIEKVVEIEGAKYSAAALDDSLVLVGCIRTSNQMDWVLKEGKYNIRIDTGEHRDGAVAPDGKFFNVKHLLLYMEGKKFAAEYYDVTENNPLEYAGLERLRKLNYPFNVRRTPADTYYSRVEKAYNNRIYMLYGINNEPIKFPSGKKIDLDNLFIDYIHDDDPLGMPFLLKMSDLIKYLI